ncbi:HAUS augmin-like complex subunit 2 [Melanotaenia boesemani]|uniref:HAUS augmin-like complex subunit 2 n=1 Tax=Melanotaenia boesemani TaxID=1250792 RepID=UPI001C05BB46|nr:HAUS augmin-like complex subunit 2 [Melanotaenia boesemani]
MVMHQWDLAPFYVTPAASLLSRCVSVGAASQEEIDPTLSHPSPTFSFHLEEAEERIRVQKLLDELHLQLELLKADMQSADVAHVFHLARRNEKLQTFGGHLVVLLKEQRSLRQRLMRPLVRTNLPVLAHMHRFVVDSFKLMMDFIECLEVKLRSARKENTTTDCLALLDTSHTLLLTLAAEAEMLSNRILQWRAVGSSQVTSEPPPPPPGPTDCGL